MTQLPGQTPPHSIEAEQATIGSMLIEPMAIERAQSLLKAADFYRDHHAWIFSAAVDLHDQGQPVDLVTMQEELKRREQLQSIQLSYLLSLFDTVPTAARVQHYAGIVAEKAQRRALAEAATSLLASAYGDAPLPELLKRTDSNLVRLAARINSNTPILQKRKTIRERTVDLADVELLTDLPYLFGKYLIKGMAHWLTGVTGVGKSTLLFNMACALAEGEPRWGIDCEQTRILYCDLESGDRTRGEKLERLYQGSKRVRGQLIFLKEPIKLPEEMDDLLRYVQEENINLVIFDTARRVFSVKNEDDNAEVYRQVVPTLDALKLIGVASLTMGHPSKNGNGSARGAGAQEDAGDINLSLTMHNGMDKEDPHGIISLRVTKNRMLGLGIPPLLLRRIGEDQFERADNIEAPPPAEKPKKADLCADDILGMLRTSQQPVKHKQILNQMLALGHSDGTARRVIGEMQKSGVIENLTSDPNCTGYVIALDNE